jgi:hypothetical protein
LSESCFNRKNSKFDQKTENKSRAHKQLTVYFQMRKYFCRHLHSSLISMVWCRYAQCLYALLTSLKSCLSRMLRVVQKSCSHPFQLISSIRQLLMSPKVHFQSLLFWLSQRIFQKENFSSNKCLQNLSLCTIFSIL